MKCNICEKLKTINSNYFCTECKRRIQVYVSTKKGALRWLDREKFWDKVKQELLAL